MKHSRSNSNEEVEKTLLLLERMEQVEVSHFFRARLMQRIEREFGPEAEAAARSPWQLNYRLALMLLLIILNLGSALVIMTEGRKESAPALSDVMKTIRDDYASPSFAYYDQTQSIPATETEP